MDKRLKRTIALEGDFEQFLKQNLSTESFAVLRKFCKGSMRSYFGFYENLEVDFAPGYDNQDCVNLLTKEQRGAFNEAFRVLKEKAPFEVMEAIRQFCHC